jgi:hypothetical protein
MGLITTTVVLLLSVLITAAAYAQGSAIYDEIDDDHQPLVEEIANKALNQTADRIVISEDPARMTIIYENITVMNNGDSGDVEIRAPHNFTSAASAAQGGGGGREGIVVLDEIDEDNQPLIEGIVNKALNQTADRISIFEDGGLVIEYYNNTTSDDPFDDLFGGGKSVDDIVITAPHNFTRANGYEFRDGTIIEPDGTELFAD